MHFSEMSDVVMVQRIMMMLVMGAGFQFSSLTSGVVGQSVTAGDQRTAVALLIYCHTGTEHYTEQHTQALQKTTHNKHKNSS